MDIGMQPTKCHRKIVQLPEDHLFLVVLSIFLEFA